MQTILAKSGYLTPERAEQVAAAERRTREIDRQLIAGKLRAGCGVFPKYATASLDDLDYIERVAPEALEDYRWVRDELERLLEAPAMIVLRGENGPGKTHLASGLVNRFCDHCRPAKYTTAADFFLELKSTFNESGRTQMDLVKRYRGYDILVLDEIEVRSDSTWENQVLRSLIDARYASNVATVLITNKTEVELHTYFSPAIRDRLREDGAIIACEWSSLRGRRIPR